MDSSTEEHLFDRLNLGEPRASRDLSFLDRQAGLEEDSAEPRRILLTATAVVRMDSTKTRRIEATAIAVLRMESAEADTFLIDRMWRSLELRHPFSLDCTCSQESATYGSIIDTFCSRTP